MTTPVCSTCRGTGLRGFGAPGIGPCPDCGTLPTMSDEEEFRRLASMGIRSPRDIAPGIPEPPGVDVNAIMGPEDIFPMNGPAIMRLRHRIIAAILEAERRGAARERADVLAFLQAEAEDWARVPDHEGDDERAAILSVVENISAGYHAKKP